MKILLTLSYLGTDFCGYQVQKDKRTVQGELNRAARELFGFDCDITGCSRTDSGVHANMFCAAVTKSGEGSIDTAINISKIPAAMNVRLPEDISVIDAIEAEDSFHPRYDVKYKEYVYKIYSGKYRSPMQAGRAWHIPSCNFDEEALSRMNIAAKAFMGEHDFSAFMASGSKVESTVRRVFDAVVSRDGDIVTFKVSADGFLYNMVRIMTGTLVSVAMGKIPCDGIGDIIASKDRARAGATAPAEGLYLNRVVY